MPRIHPMCAAMATASNRYLSRFPTEFAKAVAAIHHPTPTNFHNPESEDTPPHNPVMGPVVGTAAVTLHYHSKTVPPEVGKRYVCRNGSVTETMQQPGDGYATFPFMAVVNGERRRWCVNGRWSSLGYDSPHDLITEYHEPEPSQPAESPDDWVTQDRVPLRHSDEFRWNWDNGTVSPWLGNCQWTYKHGDIYKGDTREIRRIEIRCRRKDLPVVPEDPHALPSPWRPMTAVPTCDWFWLAWNDGQVILSRDRSHWNLRSAAAWMPAVPPLHPNDTTADKPRMRQVTLREYTSLGVSHWTTATTMTAQSTGRTAVVEVPE